MNSKILAVIFTFLLAVFSISCECTTCRLPPGSTVRVIHTHDDGSTSVETVTVGRGGCITYNCDDSHDPIIRVPPYQS